MKITALALLVLVAAAVASGCGMQGDDGVALDKPKPPPKPDAPPITYPDPSMPGVVVCFLEGAPNQTCKPGVACNFNNYNSFHDGMCTNSYPQTYGLETCDGPEDCAAGSHCCVVTTDTGDGFLETIACQTAACQTAAGSYEMCHPTSNAWGTCSDTSRHCVTAKAAGDYSIAANLYVCN